MKRADICNQMPIDSRLNEERKEDLKPGSRRIPKMEGELSRDGRIIQGRQDFGI
jgi:hypothetical protein